MLSADFYPAVFDSLPDLIVILDDKGSIQYANSAWNEFALENKGDPAQSGVGINYLNICDKSALAGDPRAAWVAKNLRKVSDGKLANFSFEYACHSPLAKHWFKLKAWPMQHKSCCYSILTHENVTSATLKTESLRQQALTDSLTGIANRRHFDQFLHQEWRRDMREKTPLSIVLLDLDFFKLFNDRYGHVAGDNCLKRVGELIDTFAKRPSDLAVRYGGEEFILVLGGTPLAAAKQIAHELRRSIEALNISNKDC